MTTVHTPAAIPLADLSGFLIAHAGMRQELGLLARVARQELSAARRLLLEDQLAMVLELMHHHHATEDERVWPRLRARAPEAGPVLDLLAAEHDLLGPLVAACRDTDLPLHERADYLERLHVLVGAHLEREEEVAVPLMQTLISVQEHAADAAHLSRAIGGRRVATMYGWFASAADEELLEAALAGVPSGVRVVFRLVWWPAYRRRARALYGDLAPVSVWC